MLPRTLNSRMKPVQQGFHPRTLQHGRSCRNGARSFFPWWSGTLRFGGWPRCTVPRKIGRSWKIKWGAFRNLLECWTLFFWLLLRTVLFFHCVLIKETPHHPCWIVVRTVVERSKSNQIVVKNHLSKVQDILEKWLASVSVFVTCQQTAQEGVANEPYYPI